MTARATLSAEGVDLQTGALLSWDGGALASLHCSIVGGTATSASVTGSGGRIDVPNGFFFPDLPQFSASLEPGGTPTVTAPRRP